jgi:hypothetical protein
MLDVLVFALRQLLRRNFWFLVVATFFGVLAMWARSEFRNQIFQDAAGTVGKRFYP